MNRPARIYYHYSECEEFRPNGGMWRVVTGEQANRCADAAAELMANPPKFRDAMRRALTEWPKSCAVAFTAEGNNQRAWLGHAGCFLGAGSLEACTRAGWHMLDDGEQYAANAAADGVIAEWRAAHWSMPGQLDLFGMGERSA